MIININTIVITIIIIICRSIILSCQRWSIVAMKYQSPVSLLIVFDIPNVDWQCNKNQSKVIIGLRPDAVSKREREMVIQMEIGWYLSTYHPDGIDRSIHPFLFFHGWLFLYKHMKKMMKKYKMFVFKLMGTMKTMKL